MNIGLTFPTRGRVKKTARLLLSIKDLHRHKITVCLGLDGDDPELDDYCKLTNLANELNPNLRVVPVMLPGEWRGLGFATNYICENLPDDVEVISMIADDMIFGSPADLICDEIETTLKGWPDMIGGVVFNDRSYNFDRPMPIAMNGFFHRNWFRALGYFFPNEIKGDYADNYLTDVCLMLERYHVCRTLEIPHLHQTYFAEEADETGNNKRVWEQSVGYGTGKEIYRQAIVPRLNDDMWRLRAYSEHARYCDVRTSQVENFTDYFNEFFGEWQPNLILEFGTECGGLALYLSDKFPDVSIHTFDIRWCISAKAYLRKNISFHYDDLFADDVQQEIKKLIQSTLNVLVLCDGGDKVKEFNTVAPWLTPGDVVMAHDYRVKESDPSPWESCEIQYADIEQAVEQNNLQTFQPFMVNAAWASFQK